MEWKRIRRQIADTANVEWKVVRLLSDLFTATPMLDTDQLFGFEHHVSRSDNQFLLAPFQFEEFEIAIKQMHPDKASGLDGLNPAFFRSFGCC